MKKVVDRLGHLRADPANALQIGDTGAAYGLGGAEMLQESPFPGRTDSGHFVERRGRKSLFPTCPVRSDGETMRLVAQCLDTLKSGVARFQHQRVLTFAVDALASGVSVGAFGHGGDIDVRQAEFFQHVVSGR